MKRLVLLSVLAVFLAFLMPLAFYMPGRSAGAQAAATPAPPAETDPPAGETEGESVLDADMPLRALRDEELWETTMAEYLPLALAGEMPASFELEALKAQAVALRSYVLWCCENPKQNHPEADVCASSGCCTALAELSKLREEWGGDFDTYYARICRAVSETDGQYLVYEEKPILAVFHSSSLGRTEDGGNIFSAQPYLVSVSSPETADTVRNLETTVEVSADDFRLTVLKLFPQADLSGEAAGWVGEITPNSTGRVAGAVIGGVEISGLTLRQMFGLRSTDFTLDYEEGRFVFHVSGYGHGVGMSQYGANTMAAAGADYAEILEHYYPESQLVVSVRLG
ncbi:MAG: stage II sporulation protein D [Oscillospiraceae bacterium]